MSPSPAAWIMFASGETRPVERVSGDWACLREPLTERPVSVCVAGQTCRGILEQRATPCAETPKGRECAPCATGELALHLGVESAPDARDVRCPSGTVPLGGTPLMCQPTQEAQEQAQPQPQPTVWNPGQDERWTAEFTAHGFIGVSLDHGFGGAAGGDVAVGFRHLDQFDRHIPFDDLGWAVIFVAPVVPFLLVPSGIWVGNEIGADFVVHGMGGFGMSSPQTNRLFFGLRPIMRITTEEGRFRFPAVLGGFLPELGMGVAKDEGAEFFLSAHQFTISYLVAPHLAIELDPVESLFVPFGSTHIQGVFGINLGLVAR